MSQACAASDDEESTALGQAVAAFNEQCSNSDLGIGQPPLTAGEVVAAIHAWDPSRLPEPQILDAYLKLADERSFPNNARFTYRNSWTTVKHEIQVWCISLQLTFPDNRRHEYLIRSQKISSRPLTDQEISRRKGGPTWKDLD